MGYERNTATGKILSRGRHRNGERQSGIKHKRGDGFVAIDGEGVENDYVLLDSNISSYPRLYTGTRLQTAQVLPWLEGLSRQREARNYDLILFGSGYDYNNWLRDIPFESLVRLHHGLPVYIGEYVVQWQQGYRFLVGKKEQRSDSIRQIVNAWDVQPFWQTNFIKAIESTLGEVPSIIKEGKDLRGSFTHEMIEWVSDYNREECRLAVLMMQELQGWMREANLSLTSWNGPGAAAKALLRRHQPYLHAGRELRDYKSPYLAVGPYTWPSEVMTAVLSSYAGGRNQLCQLGTAPVVYEHDIISAYPWAMIYLPCLTHGHWEHVTSYEAKAFGFYRFTYTASEDEREHGIYPFFHRDSTDGSINYPPFVSRWAYSEELATALRHSSGRVRIHEGWVWRADYANCSHFKPLDWIAKAFMQRKGYKAAGLIGAATAIKLALNSIYGSLAQAKGGEYEEPPWTQQLAWASAITATIRSRLYEAAMTNPFAVLHLATDGIMSTEPLKVAVGKKLGDWETGELHNAMFVQYGVYFSDEKSRTRGFYLEEQEQRDLQRRVLECWQRETGYIQSWYTVPYFVTAGLVANKMEPYEEWCHWKERRELFSILPDTQYTVHEAMPRHGTLVRMIDTEHAAEIAEDSPSAPYSPKWGKGTDFPDEWKAEDAFEQANATTEVA